jgi:guanine nucleotide-binding protein G(I)/G(S)/G(T) subunit beta-1
MSSATTERIAAAKKQVETLKAQMAQAQQDKTSGYPGIQKIASSKNVPALGSLPKVRRILKGHFGKVYAMHWSADSTHLVSASQDGKLIVWNAMQNVKTQAIPLRSSWVMTCAFEPSKGNLVACGGLDNLCSVYQVNQQQQVNRAYRELAAHDGYLSCCRFVNESSILTSSGDSTCIFWDLEMGQTKLTFTDHEGDVMSISMLPSVDANMFVSGSCDTLAKVWDIRTGKSTMTLRGHESDINSVSLFPDGKALGTGSDDSSCRFFDMRCCGEISEFRNDMVLCGITSVSFSASGRLLFAGYDDFNCLGWDTLGATDKSIFQLQAHENRVSCVGVSPSGDSLCTGSWDTMLKIWA